MTVKPVDQRFVVVPVVPLSQLPDPVVPHELQVLRGIIVGEIEPYTTFGFPSHGRDR